MTEPSKSNNRRPVPAAPELSIGQVARRAGVAVSTLHFYERQGLLESRRNRGNQRRYSRGVLRRVAIIKIAQTTGIPLSEIKQALDGLPHGRTPTAKDWEMLSARWKDDLDRRIANLENLRDRLSGCIGCGCLSIKDCPLRNPGDEAGRNGTGARFLEP